MQDTHLTSEPFSPRYICLISDIQMKPLDKIVEAVYIEKIGRAHV